MMNKSKLLRILALFLALITLIPAAPALAESYKAITSAPQMAYKDAGLSKKAGEIPAFTIVNVKGVKGDVAKVTLKGAKDAVFTDADTLVDVADIAIPAKTSQKTRVYEQPDTSSRSSSVKKGFSLNVLALSGDWALVEKDGNTAYALVDTLTSGEDEPSKDDDPFLPDGSQNGGDVTVKESQAKLTQNTTVFKKASTSSEKLGTVKKGQVVTVQAYNDGWAYIELDGKRGFCKLKYLEKIEEEVQPDDGFTSMGIAVTVTAASVKVYEKASESAKSLGTLKKGAEVTMVSYSGDWAYIQLNGKHGYCAIDALTRTSDLEDEDKGDKGEVIGGKEPIGTATVVEATAPLYSKMSTSANSVNLKLGNEVTYYGYDSKWILVGRDGQFGFMLRKHLSADSYAELKLEDSGASVKDMETALLALGYLDGVPGSNYTNLTADAVRRLQAACGMEQTGEADVNLLRVLYSGNAPVSPMLSVNLSSGSTGDNVERLQTRLHALGYLSRSGSIDGDYGNTTSAAIRLFQKQAGMSATGAADNKTIRALYHAAAPALASGTDAADAASGGSSGSSSNSTEMGDLSSNVNQYVQGMSNAKKLEYVIYIAQQQLGKRYVFGSAGTATFDCSGLTMYCFKQIGVSLPHSAYSQGYNDSRKKISSISSLRRGDLVFFNTMSDSDQCDHVGIYLGNNSFIHASSGSAKVVVSNLASGYYNRVFSWGRRVLDA